MSVQVAIAYPNDSVTSAVVDTLERLTSEGDRFRLELENRTAQADQVVVATGPAVSAVFASKGPLMTWMWEAVVVPVKPVNVTFTPLIRETGSIVTVVKPVPGDAFGGSSAGPERLAVNTIGAA